MPNSRPPFSPQGTLRPGFGLGGVLERTLPPPLREQLGFHRPTVPSAGRIGAGTTPADADLAFLGEALLCAMDSVGRPNPNPAVGCLLVRDSRIIARGATEPFGGRHAERVAFDSLPPEALKATSPLTAYVTLEPCSHTGRQPPCVDLLLNAPAVTRVVVAAQDPNPLVNGEGLARLRAAGKQVDVGPLGPESVAWNFPFFLSKVFGRPALVAKWAQSLDGQLADDTSRSQWITGPAARAHTHWLRQKHDAILVGAGTLLRDAPRLDVRDCALPHQARPLRLVFDPRARLLSLTDEDARRLEGSTFADDAPLVVLIPRNAGGGSQPTPTAASRALLDAGRVVPFVWKTQGDERSSPLSASASSPDLPPDLRLVESLVEFLRSGALDGALGRPLQSVFCEGGPWLLARLLALGAVDACHAFVAPFVLGSTRHGLTVAEAQDGPRLLADVSRLRLLSQARLGDDTLLELVPPEVLRRVFEPTSKP